MTAMLDCLFHSFIPGSDVAGDGGNPSAAFPIAAALPDPVRRPGGRREASLRGRQPWRTRIARDERQIRAIGRLRYEHFIDRDRGSFGSADHAARLFLDPVDALSLNFFVDHNDRPLAALRLTHALDAVSDDFLLQVVNHSGLSAAELAVTIVISRLVVRNEMRAHLSLPGLFRAACRAGRASGARYCIMATRPALVALYRRVGFIPNGQGFVHPDAGDQLVAVFDDRLDRVELKGVNARFYDRWTNTSAVGAEVR